MFAPSALARSLETRSARTGVARIVWDARQADRPASRRIIARPQPIAGRTTIARYVEGWAEANAAKIVTATAPGFRFCDPLVGTFTQRTLHHYFDIVRERLSAAGPAGPLDVAFVLHGPMDRTMRGGELKFWREAPTLGLTGESAIKVGESGIVADSVVYDLNLACELLRQRLVAQSMSTRTTGD